VTLSSKVEESQQLNALARTQGFVESPEQAVKKAQGTCVPDPKRKWRIELNESSPLIHHEFTYSKPRYGAYQVVCFPSAEAGQKQLHFSTAHVGGGYSKAYYVLPEFYLFTKELKPVSISHSYAMKQDFLSGAYESVIPVPLEAQQTYYLVVVGNNREPGRPWSSFTNPALGIALQGVFPVEVYSSPYGVVAVELQAKE
jgi:hypothetical protein